MTVEKHRANLMSKLNVHDLAGLIRAAIKQGIFLLTSSGSPTDRLPTPEMGSFFVQK
jgi:hypothetical protein